MNKNIDIIFENEEYKEFLIEKELKDWSVKILNELQNSSSFCSISFISSESIQELNKKYLNKDYPTDVLSFSQKEGENIDFINSQFLGDIVICYLKAKEQAKEAGYSLIKEVKLLILHGILHLLNYDHEIDNGEMNDLQNKIFLKLTGEIIE